MDLIYSIVGALFIIVICVLVMLAINGFMTLKIYQYILEHDKGGKEND